MTITFEELREIQRNEKKIKAIQQLPEEFWKLVKEYFREKMKRYEELKERKTKLADKLLLQFERELINAVGVVEDLYTLREKKIITLAWVEASTGEAQDTMALTEEERELYERIVGILKEYRSKVLESAIYGEILEEEAGREKEKVGEEVEKKRTLEGAEEVEREEEVEEVEEKREEKPKDVVRVKIKAKVPAFLGRDLKIYGPFNPGEVVELPRIYAKLLVEKGKAEPA